MRNIILFSFMSMAVACGTKDDTADEDTAESNPSSDNNNDTGSQTIEEPEPQEVLLYYTSMWSGEWTVTETELNGHETIESSSGLQETAGVRCAIKWDMVGTVPATPGCEDCIFEFEIAATYNGTDSNLDVDGDGTDLCTDSATDATFSYGYTADYQYDGESLGEALLYDGGDGYGAFVAPSSPNAPDDPAYSASISWDETTGFFSYSGGYVDYEYLYVY